MPSSIALKVTEDAGEDRAGEDYKKAGAASRLLLLFI
jgi:hypothetical protein